MADESVVEIGRKIGRGNNKKNGSGVTDCVIPEHGGIVNIDILRNPI
ncbi:hypothetical protein PITCH_A2170004 [uncultured Desulfobacterium sp.]|uniref:Uncharacterized protein n=1 Tax=uncultured Desulfobacterium sp. TaxID=201089 RepID=A0A445MXT2_9BACT|nr:hypothetical protein PITCH_A2170004 [uncultured Desulfobacterium sp.]